MKKLYRMVLAGVACAGLAACSDQLDVVNLNNADQERALARPTDVEALISGSYNTFHRNTLGSTNLSTQMYVLGMENYSALANFSMGARATIPRPPISNERGNAVATENFGNYLGLHRAARAAALGLSRVVRTDFTFFPPNAAQTQRAKAFAHFVIGVALGSVSLVYDSGSAISEADDLTALDPLPFVGYDSLNRYALARLDSAIAAAGTMTGQTIPTTWMATSAALTQAQFIALARGWKARLRAAVARTPAERAAVRWDSVINNASQFVAAFPADFVQSLNPALGWDAAWLPTMYQSSSVNWHMLWGYMAHMAAPQAELEAWLNTVGGPSARQAFTMHSPDLRWPQGASRANQQADASAARYAENRGSDWQADPSATSQYRHKRFLALNTAGRVGNFPSMTTAEMNLLQAEGHIMAGNFTLATPLIDATRVARGGLPSVAGVTNATTVPGGASCVPRIPTAPTYLTTACGNLFEALKYEKRMETQYTMWGSWWWDGRGWGDLPVATPHHWPVPYQEMDARGQAFYSVQGTAPVGTYGL